MMPSAQAGTFPAAGGQPLLPHAALVPTGHLTGITPEGMPVNIEFGGGSTTNMTAAGPGPGGEQVVDPNWIASRIAQNPVSPVGFLFCVFFNRKQKFLIIFNQGQRCHCFKF